MLQTQVNEKQAFSNSSLLLNEPTVPLPTHEAGHTPHRGSERPAAQRQEPQRGGQAYVGGRAGPYSRTLTRSGLMVADEIISRADALKVCRLCDTSLTLTLT